MDTLRIYLKELLNLMRRYVRIVMHGFKIFTAFLFFCSSLNYEIYAYYYTLKTHIQFLLMIVLLILEYRVFILTLAHLYSKRELINLFLCRSYYFAPLYTSALKECLDTFVKAIITPMNERKFELVHKRSVRIFN